MLASLSGDQGCPEWPRGEVIHYGAGLPGWTPLCEWAVGKMASGNRAPTHLVCTGLTHRHWHTDTHRHSHTDTGTQTHTDTHTQTQAHRHTDTHTHIYTDTHTHTYTQTHTHIYTDTHTHTEVNDHKVLPQSLEGCLVAWNPRNVSNLPIPIVRVQFYHL